VSGAPVPFTVLQEAVGLPEDILKRVIHSLACGTLHVVLQCCGGDSGLFHTFVEPS
jgi:hypothetical protein